MLYKKLKSQYIFDSKDIDKFSKSIVLSDVISMFIPLKKSKNGDYYGRCPLCKEVTLNNRHFRISDKKKVYKCFECGRSGKHAHTFIMEYFNIPFDKSIFFLKRKYPSNNLKYVRMLPYPTSVDGLELPF